MKTGIEFGSNMKLMIFYLLSCTHINYFHCEETNQNDKLEIPILHREIGKNYLTPLKEISTPETDQVKSNPRTQKLPEALELIRVKKTKKDGKKFVIRRDFIPMSQTKNVKNVAYFCPPEFENQDIRSSQPEFQFCWYLKVRNDVVLSSVNCIYEPRPLLWNYPDEKNACGEDHMAILYTFRHKVCWKDESFLLKLPKVKDERDRIKKMQRENIEVYSICLRRLEQVLYLKYDLIIASYRELSHIKDNTYELQTKTEGKATLDFKNWSKLFETKNLQFLLEKKFGNRLDDTLIPQMLISQTHVKPNVAKNALHNYLNIKPQWQSVENNWLQLEYYIWNLGSQYSRGIFIYAGTYNYDKIDEKKRKQLNFQIDEEFTQSIPFIWWKLIVNKDNEGIILAVQNEPKLKGKSYSSEKLCKKSICKMHGWNEVDKFGYCCAYDEEKRKLLNLSAEKIKIFRVFNPTKHRSRVTTWFMNLLKI